MSLADKLEHSAMKTAKHRQELVPPPSVSASSSATQKYSISLHRKGAAVHVILTAVDEYSAIELFDTLKCSAERGSFNLSVMGVSS